MMADYAIKCVTPQNQPPDPSFCTEVEVTLKTADNFLDGQHKLTITNIDGQMAAATFPLDGLTIRPVDNLAPGTTPVSITVPGANFVEGMTGLWKNAAGVETPIVAGQIQKTSNTQLKVTLVPGAAGSGTLTLVSPIGLRAHVAVSVAAPTPPPTPTPTPTPETQ